LHRSLSLFITTSSHATGGAAQEDSYTPGLLVRLTRIPEGYAKADITVMLFGSTAHVSHSTARRRSIGTRGVSGVREWVGYGVCRTYVCGNSDNHIKATARFNTAHDAGVFVKALSTLPATLDARSQALLTSLSARLLSGLLLMILT
jgi:hypothetical protein